MKKVLAVLAVVLMMSTSAFAVSITKELAKGGLPGALYNEGSLSTVGLFPSTIGQIANIALLDYVGDPIGALVVKTDLGILGLVITPNMDYDLDDVSVWQVNDKAMVLYGTSTDSMNIGGALTIGMRNYNIKDLDVEANGANPDVENDSRLLLGLSAGVSLLGDMPIDVALAFTMANESDLESNDYQPSGNLDQEETEANSFMDIQLAGRTKLAGWTTVLSVDYLMGSEKSTNKEDTDNDGDLDADETWTTTNSSIAVNLLAGNTIKASETLAVTVGTGLMYSAYGDDKSTYKDDVSDSESISGGTWSEATLDIPLWVAVEGKLNETWTVLSGVSARLVGFRGYGAKYDDEPAADEQDLKPYYEESWLNIAPNFSDNDQIGQYTVGTFNVGLEGKIGDLTLDMNVTPSILLLGPNFISGMSVPLNSSVALSYAWK